MRLSEAILLGSTVVAPKPGRQYFSESESGCALGMAAIARGCEYRPNRQAVPEQDRRTLGTEGVWGQWVMGEVVRPCDCWRFRVPREMRIKDVIAHIFDYHVMTKKNWTLERLAAWVKTVEPAADLNADPNAEPKAVAPLEMTKLEHARLMVSESRELQREAEEWQTVRQAFEAKHSARRRRIPSA
jgi:hypothetical protein